MSFSAAVQLRNDLVALVPLSHEHGADLAAAAADGELWRLWYTMIPHPDDTATEIDRRLAEHDPGRMAPWTVLVAGKPVGMTTYFDISEADRHLEIGYTWLAKSVQRTGVNPAMKLLLLERAFDVLGCVRVQFCTDWHNQQSREALTRLGARQEGVLRKHRVRPDYVRDTVVFSILDHEWPAVRLGLQARMGAYS